MNLRIIYARALLAGVLTLMLLLPQQAMAGEDLPSAREGIRTMYVAVGPLNYGATVPGVAQEWHEDCLEGRVQDCQRIARAFETGLGDLRKDVQAATGYLSRSCRISDGAACARAAEYLNEGFGGPSYPRHAAELAMRGCQQLRNDDACGYHGLAMWTGEGAAEDRAAALALWQRTCRDAVSESCRLLAGKLHYDSTASSDHARAADLYARACEGGAAWGCYGEALAFMKGRGRAKDDVRAFALARRACFESEGDTMHPCGLWAEYTVEHGKSSDSETAGTTLHMACVGGRATSCSMAALAAANNGLGTGILLQDGPFYARRGCELGLPNACVQLLNFYSPGAHPKVRASGYYQVALAKRACSLGHAQSCDLMRSTAIPDDFDEVNRIDFAAPIEQQLAEARQAVESGDARYGIERIARLMEEGDAEASWRLGNLFLEGYPGIIDRSPDDAIILIENAARVGHVEAAEFMGMAYWYGENVQQNHETGKSYMRIAISGGSEMAEAIYRSMLAEPERQRRAEAARRAAERARANAGRFDLGRAIASWKPNIGNYISTVDTSASWARYQARADQTAWNNAMSYASGRSSVCPSFNKYC